MKKVIRICASVMMSAISISSFAQGYTMNVDGTPYKLNDGDVISLIEENPGEATLSFVSEGNDVRVKGKKITFEGKIELDYQNLLNSVHYNYYSKADGFGLGSIMVARDGMTADVIRSNSGYNWFSIVYNNQFLPDYRQVYHYWRYFINAISCSNKLINALQEVKDRTDEQNRYLAIAYAFRAMNYLDMARMYEYLPTDATLPISILGKDVTNLTVPIITEVLVNDGLISEKPRATRQEMASFILNDLEMAQSMMPKKAVTDKRVPGYVAILGLKARLGMWIGNYQLAESASAEAISLNYNTPLQSSEILDVLNGFNCLTPSSWIWGAQSTEDNWYNSWGSWMSSEADGYTSVGVQPIIPVSLYNEIGSEDPRKQLYRVTGNEPVRSDSYCNYDDLSQYSSLKFRAYGENCGDYYKAAFPLMRIEELILINAEAKVRLGEVSEGKSELVIFVKKYRDSNYSCAATSEDEVIDAIFEQKRIELWGEGQIYFDYKRLNKPVIRTVEDGWPESYAFATTTRPAWMNMVFPPLASTHCPGIIGNENPQTANLYFPNGGYEMGKVEADAYLVDGVFSELLGYKGLLSEYNIKITSSDNGHVLTVENPFNELANNYPEYISFTDSLKNHQLYFALLDSIVSIPEQEIGIKYKGSSVKVKSVKYGVLRNGIISFPESSISVDVAGKQTLLNNKGNFRIRLNGASINNSYISYYGSFNPGKNQWKLKEENGKKQIGIRLYLRDVDEVRIVATPENDRDSYLYSLLSGKIDYSKPDADSIAWITVPNHLDECDLLVVGAKDGIVSTTRTFVLSGLRSDVYDLIIYDNMKDPDGKDMLRTRVIFHGYVEQGYIALVKSSMSDEEVLDAFKKNALTGIYKTNKPNYSISSSVYAFPHYPEELTRYRLAAIGEMNDGTVQILRNTNAYYDDWNYVNPQVNLQLESEFYPDSVSTYVSVSYSYENAPSKLVYVLCEADKLYSDNLDSLRANAVYFTEPDVNRSSLSYSFNPVPGVLYVSCLIAYDASGEYLEHAKNEYIIYKDEFVPVAYGQFVSDFWGETFNNVALEYSASQNLYRISNWLGLGGYITFYWNKETNQVTMSEDKFETGFLYSNEYMTYGVTTAPDCVFYYENGTFYFKFRFDVPGLGTFGYYVDTFTLN